MPYEIAQTLFEIGERYAVYLRDTEMPGVKTFGDLVETVKQKIDEPVGPGDDDASILAALIEALRLQSPSDFPVDAETDLRRLLPMMKRVAVWDAVQKRFPELPDWLNVNEKRGVWQLDWTTFVWIGLILLWAGIGGVLASYQDRLGGGTVFGIMVLMMIPMAAFLCWMSARLPCRTVADWAKLIADKRKIRQTAQAMTVEEIENELRTYIAKTFAVEHESIRRESRLAEDLDLE